MICEKCKRELRGSMSGQGFTDWTCDICGETFTHCNTNVPKVCKECSEKYHICEQCGEVIKKKKKWTILK